MRFSTAIVASALAAFTFTARPSAQAPGAGRLVTGEILVQFRPGAAATAKADAHRQAGGTVLNEIARTGVQLVGIAAGDERGAIARYQRNPNVLYAEPNYIRSIPEPLSHSGPAALPGDYWFKEQWALHNTGQQFYCIVPDILCLYIGTPDADIDAPEAWAISTGSADVTVAVIDTGIDYNHPDLVGRYVGGWNFLSNNNDPMDDHGHGTHVSGTIAAALNNLTGNPAEEEGVVGVAPNARIRAYKVCDAGGFCNDFAIEQAIARAVTEGARVINMSLGAADVSQTLDGAVQDAWNAGLVIVAGAGNDGNTNRFYPAAFENVIAVGAFDEDHRRASFSNYGTWVDISAPGNAIMSSYPLVQCGGATTVPGDTGCYNWLSGTSMATPHVAGAAALVWSRADVTNNSQVVSIILNSAEPQGVATVPLNSWTIHGGLNIHNALSYGSTNLPPIANAGADQTRTDSDGNGVESITLDGSASTDPDGGSLSYVWLEGVTELAYVASPTFGFSVGTHTLTLRVTDDEGSSATDTVNVTVNPQNTATSAHIADLDGSSSTNRGNWTARVTIAVHNTNHQSVNGARVTGTWRWNGSSASGECTTGTSGTCLLPAVNFSKKTASVTFTVNGIVATGLSYAGADNHDIDGGTNGTVVTISKP